MSNCFSFVIMHLLRIPEPDFVKDMTPQIERYLVEVRSGDPNAEYVFRWSPVGGFTHGGILNEGGKMVNDRPQCDLDPRTVPIEVAFPPSSGTEIRFYRRRAGVEG